MTLCSLLCFCNLRTLIRDISRQRLCLPRNEAPGRPCVSTSAPLGRLPLFHFFPSSVCCSRALRHPACSARLPDECVMPGPLCTGLYKMHIEGTASRFLVGSKLTPLPQVLPLTGPCTRRGLCTSPEPASSPSCSTVTSSVPSLMFPSLPSL